MEWTEKDKEVLLSFKKTVDNDNIRFKELIKQKLLDNKYIIHALNNKELEDSESEADEYFNVNILPYYMIPDTQTSTKNFICFETSFDKAFGTDRSINNKIIKKGQIIFYVLCHHEDIIDSETGISRHDLLGALLLDQFNWTNIFGIQVHCVSDRPSTTDSRYATRTLILQGEAINSIAKTKDNITRIINSDVVR